MKIKTTLTALALSCVASIASAQTTFTFSDSSTVIGTALDAQLSGSFTVSGIKITAEASEANFNATGSGFGINQVASGDDTAGFDFTESGGPGNSEGFTLTFDQDVNLNSFSVSSWNAGVDEVTLSDGATVVGTISSTGSTSLGNYLLGITSTLTVATTAGSYSNGWSFDSITVTAVPEPSTYALLAGMLALTSIMLRRRSM